MDLSIIIPIYNADRFLVRCLESVLKAIENKKVEIILVNNNSTDNSPKIIKEYVKKYPKLITSLDFKTPSCGAARNYGVKSAKGKYLWFIDADDEITENSVTLLFEKIAKNNVQPTSDISAESALFSVKSAKNNTKNAPAIAKTNTSSDSKQNRASAPDLVMLGAERRMLDGSKSYLSAVDADDKNYKSRFVRYGMGPWQVLIRREWWNRNQFKFREDIIQEDMELMSSLILYTDNYLGLDEPLYLYYENPESILHKSKFSPKVFDIFPALEGLLNRFEKAGAAKKYYAELEWFFIWNLLIDSAKDFAKFKEARPGFARSRAVLKEYFPNWRKNQFLKEKPLKLRLRVRLNYYK